MSIRFVVIRSWMPQMTTSLALFLDSLQDSAQFLKGVADAMAMEQQQ